jgi:hypothetical protein
MSGEALLFAWTEPGDHRKNRQGTVWVLRVTP